MTAAYFSTNAKVAGCCLGRSRGIAACFVRLRIGHAHLFNLAVSLNDRASNLAVGPTVTNLTLLLATG
jgi:hypothetical protein